MVFCMGTADMLILIEKGEAGLNRGDAAAGRDVLFPGLCPWKKKRLCVWLGLSGSGGRKTGGVEVNLRV